MTAVAGAESIGVASPDVPNLAWSVSMEGRSPTSSAAQSMAPVSAVAETGWCKIASPLISHTRRQVNLFRHTSGTLSCFSTSTHSC